MPSFLTSLLTAISGALSKTPQASNVAPSQVQPVPTVAAPVVVENVKEPVAVPASVVIAPAPVVVTTPAPAIQEKMTLFVQRSKSDKGCTLGKLYVDGVFECFTLEDVIREIPGKAVAVWKIAGDTAIPAGTYDLQITFSPRFKKDLPLVLDVPGFTGIRIHPGNFAKDTDGCLLVGETQNVNDGNIGSSVAAFTTLMTKLQKALKAGKKITIQYRNP